MSFKPSAFGSLLSDFYHLIKSLNHSNKLPIPNNPQEKSCSNYPGSADKRTRSLTGRHAVMSITIDIIGLKKNQPSAPVAEAAPIEPAPVATPNITTTVPGPSINTIPPSLSVARISTTLAVGEPEAFEPTPLPDTRVRGFLTKLHPTRRYTEETIKSCAKITGTHDDLMQHVMTYMNYRLAAEADQRPHTKFEKDKLKRIESLFGHSMSGTTLKLIVGHVKRLYAFEQKLSHGVAGEHDVTTERDRIKLDISKRLSMLSKWYGKTQDERFLSYLTGLAAESTEGTFGHARYSQRVHSPKAIDCSGLTGEFMTRLLKSAGITGVSLKDVTTESLFYMNKRSKDPLVKRLAQYFECKPLHDISDLRPGDCLVRRRGGSGHAGVYIGNSKVMHSTRDRDQNGFGIDTIGEFLHGNHRIIRLKEQYRKRIWDTV